MTDYNALRVRTLGSAQEEEAVTVNTRALIDKVLARYSSENTTLRELLQNAADANASSVEVRFQTLEAPTAAPPDFRDLVRCKMRRMLVKNDGHPFREEDWQRLKRIAEGNPDETKIGAFGVGFYSVFADCEEPFVTSGNQAMAFYWKGNSLFTRRATLDVKDPFTTFLLEYREPSELPDLKDLCKFFATSLTFVKLGAISLYINDHCLLSLKKKTSPSDLLQIPELINPVTVDKLMRITRVDTERVQIDARYMKITHYRPAAAAAELASSLKSIFYRFSSSSSSQLVSQSDSPSPDDLASYSMATIFLRIATATVSTSVGTAFAKELERATKKPPPKTTKLAILSMSKDELDASEHKAEIFSNVLPGKAGKIFIGFPTHQTTGISAHISAPSVIPTVERENIDLNARVVRDWNIEMLRIAGILSRIMYTDEMSILARRVEGLRGQDQADLLEHAIHIMKQYTFTPSTPAGAVGRYIEVEFWNCCRRRTAIEVMSTKGVLPSDQVRLSSDVNFLVGLPLLPDRIEKEAAGFVHGLKEMGLLTEITITDIRNELGNKALSGAQLGLFLKWLADKRLKDDLDDIGVKSLLDAAVAMTSVSDSSVGVATIPVSLGSIRYHVIPSRLATDVPLPPDCLQFHVTKGLNKLQLGALGWEEIGIYHWLRYICSQASTFLVTQNIELSPQFAQHVLAIVSKNWDQLPPSQKDNVAELLKKRRCMPTKQGMRVPGEAYFNNVKLFADLPVVANMHGVRDKFLAVLGVRKTLELKLVFERLMDGTKADGAAKWSHVDLIRYLASVSNDIPKVDITRLKNTPICKAEAPSSQALFKVSELYEPDDSLRKLGLLILQWPMWRPTSAEGRFLSSLGLKKHPSAEMVLAIAANKNNETLREAALAYYVANHHNNGYSAYDVSSLDMAFLPLARESRGEKLPRLVTPRACFSNPRAAILGFQVLRKDLQPHATKFGVKTDPDMRDCAGGLIANPPATTRAAREQFGYLSTRLAELVPHLVEQLSLARIVPVPYKKDDVNPDPTKKLKMIPPRNCFLGDSGSQYYEIFDFVDFGQEANAFLLKCGSKHEPTVGEVAYMIVREPQRLLNVFHTPERYLGVLRIIAENWNHLKRDKTLVKEMRRSAFLGATRETTAKDEADPNALEDDPGVIREFTLVRVDQVLIIDDYVSFTLFKNEILAAPQEDILEMFYSSLGAAMLSSKVTMDWHIGSKVGKAGEAQKLNKLVLERCRLFLHNNTEETRHDAKWLENNLQVSYVDIIRQRRTLRSDGYRPLTNSQIRTAAATKDNFSKNTWLFVTPGFQFYDISQVLVDWILKRPKPHSALLLESLLTTDLMVLKSRGFNVERVLRAKAEEARIAESQRLKRLEEERRALEEKEKQHQQAVKAAELLPAPPPPAYGDADGHPPMPGAFAESPQAKSSALVPSIGGGPKDSGIFGRFGKRSWFEGQNTQKEQPKNLLNNSSTQQQQQQLQLPPAPATPPPKPAVETPTEPHRIKANLQRAVEASRSYDSNEVFSRPNTFEVKEEKSYCDSRRSHDVTYFAETALGIKLFIDRGVQDRATFLKKNGVAMNSLSKVLKDLSDVYSLALTSLHIFYDESGTSIAFNTNGSIFCNLRFFLQLHAQDAARGASQQALVYWFVVLAHELAHNLVSDHSAQHSFYAETFVQEYFMKVMHKVQQISIEAAA